MPRLNQVAEEFGFISIDLLNAFMDSSNSPNFERARPLKFHAWASSESFDSFMVFMVVVLISNFDFSSMVTLTGIENGCQGFNFYKPLKHFISCIFRDLESCIDDTN